MPGQGRYNGNLTLSGGSAVAENFFGYRPRFERRRRDDLFRHIAAQLIEDLLDVSYIESGKINLSINPVAMESVLNEVVSELAGKGAASQVMIKVKRRQRLPLVLAGW